MMRTVTSLEELKGALTDLRSGSDRIALVPTMGALHRGHEALIRHAVGPDTTVVVTCFVNPTQFGPGKDYERYPRAPEADARLAGSAGAGLLWLPRMADIYPPGEMTRVRVGPIAASMEGLHRPGHFDGVATVVIKLITAARPDLLVLGEKDWQQVVVLRQVLRDLLWPTTIGVVPVVREADGLALSSRNQYLASTERVEALALSHALAAAAEAVANGETDGATVELTMREIMAEAPSLTVEYATVAHPETLLRLVRINRPARAFVAARIGKTRLIDTRALTP